MAGYARALQTALDACDALAETIDIDNGPQLKKLVDAAVGTKFSFRYDSIITHATRTLMTYLVLGTVV